LHQKRLKKGLFLLVISRSDCGVQHEHVLILQNVVLANPLRPVGHAAAPHGGIPAKIAPKSVENQFKNQLN
jgi:hypothetical protein